MLSELDLKYKYGELVDIRNQMEQVWAKDTAYGKWNKNIPSTNQCFVTALWLGWYFDAEVVRGSIDGVQHYWNIIGRIPVDFTSDQFGGDGYNPIINEYRTGTTSRNWKNKRYLLFKERMENI